MKPSILKTHQFTLGQADISTGYIFKTDKSIYLQGGKDCLRFYSQDHAMDYIANTIVEHPNIECWIENSKEESVIMLDKYGEGKLKKAENTVYIRNAFSGLRWLLAIFKIHQTVDLACGK